MAWVAEQNARTSAELRGDPRYDPYFDTAFGLFTSSDNPAYGYVQGGCVYNFWQDDEHNLGLWRRTSPASYKTAAPDWETVIDFDALAAVEGTNWVFSYADCLAPDYRRCLIAMSPDGGDAMEFREFDLASRSFVKGGFFSPVSKSELRLARRRHADPDAGLRRKPADQLRLFAAGEVVEARHAVGAGHDRI